MAWIVATTPVFMALLGWLILKEKLSGIKILGIGLAFIGASISIGKFGAPGDKLILISSLNWAVFSALSRRGLKTYSASLMIFYVMVFGWIFSSMLFVGGGNYVEIPALSLNGWV